MGIQRQFVHGASLNHCLQKV